MNQYHLTCHGYKTFVFSIFLSLSHIHHYHQATQRQVWDFLALRHAKWKIFFFLFFPLLVQVLYYPRWSASIACLLLPVDIMCAPNLKEVQITLPNLTLWCYANPHLKINPKPSHQTMLVAGEDRHNWEREREKEELYFFLSSSSFIFIIFIFASSSIFLLQHFYFLLENEKNLIFVSFLFRLVTAHDPRWIHENLWQYSVTFHLLSMVCSRWNNFQPKFAFISILVLFYRRYCKFYSLDKSDLIDFIVIRTK